MPKNNPKKVAMPTMPLNPSHQLLAIGAIAGISLGLLTTAIFPLLGVFSLVGFAFLTLHYRTRWLKIGQISKQTAPPTATQFSLKTWGIVLAASSLYFMILNPGSQLLISALLLGGGFCYLMQEGIIEPRSRLNEQLHTAIKKGDLKGTARSLKQGADPNTAYAHANTAWHQAAQLNDDQSVKVFSLLAKKAFPQKASLENLEQASMKFTTKAHKKKFKNMYQATSTFLGNQTSKSKKNALKKSMAFWKSCQQKGENWLTILAQYLWQLHLSPMAINEKNDTNETPMDILKKGKKTKAMAKLKEILTPTPVSKTPPKKGKPHSFTPLKNSLKNKKNSKGSSMPNKPPSPPHLI